MHKTEPSSLYIYTLSPSFSFFVSRLSSSSLRPTFPLAVEMVGQDFALFRSATFYALFVLTPIICNLPEFIWRS